MWYVIAKDLAHALVGPFDSRQQARDYVRVQRQLGASSKFEIVKEAEATDRLDEVHIIQQP